MNDQPNMFFLRLEGPLQSWGDPSKFVMRRTMDAPTKSGVIGLICCAMGLSRRGASEHLLELNTLQMGVRIDRPGIRWWDYHTVGAGVGLRTAEGEIKEGAKGTLITRREYLADASFLVALRGDAALVDRVVAALRNPKWPIYLGRKSCPPTVPMLVMRKREDGTLEPDVVSGELRDALANRPYAPRCKRDAPRDKQGYPLKAVQLDCLIEQAAAKSEVWYDVPVSFDPPVQQARLVVREPMAVRVADYVIHRHTSAPERPRASYQNREYRKRADSRLNADHGLCIFCKSPATTVQHITYRRAGGNEAQEDLRALCRLCHDAVTMIEYGMGMGLDRINPEDASYRDRIIAKRKEIVEFRSLETRRRRLQPGEVE